MYLMQSLGFQIFVSCLFQSRTLLGFGNLWGGGVRGVVITITAMKKMVVIY